MKEPKKEEQPKNDEDTEMGKDVDAYFDKFTHDLRDFFGGSGIRTNYPNALKSKYYQSFYSELARAKANEAIPKDFFKRINADKVRKNFADALKYNVTDEVLSLATRKLTNRINYVMYEIGDKKEDPKQLEEALNDLQTYTFNYIVNGEFRKSEDDVKTEQAVVKDLESRLKAEKQHSERISELYRSKPKGSTKKGLFLGFVTAGAIGTAVLYYACKNGTLGKFTDDYCGGCGKPVVPIATPYSSPTPIPYTPTVSVPTSVPTPTVQPAPTYTPVPKKPKLTPGKKPKKPKKITQVAPPQVEQPAQPVPTVAQPAPSNNGFIMDEPVTFKTKKSKPAN